MNVTTSGIVLKVSIIEPGINYLNENNIGTFVSSKSGLTFIGDLIPNDYFSDNFNINKIDNLHVNITTNMAGEVITAEPNNLHRGQGYKVGQYVSVYKKGFEDYCILRIDYIS